MSNNSFIEICLPLRIREAFLRFKKEFFYTKRKLEGIQKSASQHISHRINKKGMCEGLWRSWCWKEENINSLLHLIPFNSRHKWMRWELMQKLILFPINTYNVCTHPIPPIRAKQPITAQFRSVSGSASICLAVRWCVFKCIKKKKQNDYSTYISEKTHRKWKLENKKKKWKILNEHVACSRC